jgi:hypothetical protein
LRHNPALGLRGRSIGQREINLTFWRIKMNAKKLTAAVIMFAAAGATFAQNAEFVAPDANFVSSKSRAEVIAELKQAQANGTLSFMEYNYPVIAHQDGVQPSGAKQTSAMRSAGTSQANSNIYFGS